MDLTFYVSGHGFGHASRIVEVVHALQHRRAGLSMAIRTPVARWFFDVTLRARATIEQVDCDPGVVQRDSLDLDERATVRHALAFYSQLSRRAAREAARLRDGATKLVVCDIAPLGCAAAQLAGVPAVVLANFTWDWIYADYEAATGISGLVEPIRSIYAHAEAAWRLPLSAGFDAFRRIVDVPYIARPPGRRRETRRRLGLPAAARVALASFGGSGLRRFDEPALRCLDGWTVLRTGLRNGAAVSRDGAILHVDEVALAEAGYRYEDLVAAADVVVSTPGFGIIGECAANDVALVYTSRGRFAEYDLFVREMPRYLRCTFIDQHSLLAGRWERALRAALDQPDPPGRLTTGGAAVVADLILDRLDR